MTESVDSEGRAEVALIVGGGPGISASCARLFTREGMKVAVAARTPEKPVLVDLEKQQKVAAEHEKVTSAEEAESQKLFA